MARPRRFERPTPAFGGQYSIQLSYGRGGSDVSGFGLHRPTHPWVFDTASSADATDSACESKDRTSVRAQPVISPLGGLSAWTYPAVVACLQSALCRRFASAPFLSLSFRIPTVSSTFDWRTWGCSSLDFAHRRRAPVVCAIGA